MKKFFKIKVISLIFSMLILLVSCSDGGGSDDGPEPPPAQIETLPVKAIGTLPTNGETCSDYEEVVGDEFKVLVLFNWDAAQFAESYLLTILEGNSQVFNNSFTTLSTSVELDRGKTYTWSVTSINEDGQTNGDSYSFTTPGVPTGNFVPYTAEITVMFDEASSEMTVSWVGSDEDGDPLTYDVKVFEEGMSIFESLDLAVSEIGPLSFKFNTDYGVEVISRDDSGSFSISTLEVSSPN
tara:strand:+ start:8301 stop:9017 length:717 start_codon:yes stop_codon:yes gene_type:complete